jgi:hypothetical protein
MPKWARNHGRNPVEQENKMHSAGLKMQFAGCFLCEVEAVKSQSQEGGRSNRKPKLSN